MKHTFELKNIKHAEFASEETNCYSATLYIDGKPFALVSNDGHGGCDNQHPDPRYKGKDFWAEFKAIQSTLGTKMVELKGVEPWEMKIDIECICGDLLTEWLINRDIKKALKRVCYVKDVAESKSTGSFFQLEAKFKPNPEMLKALKGAKWWKPEYVILNELPLEQVREYFNA